MAIGSECGSSPGNAVKVRIAPRLEETSVLDTVVKELQEIDRRTGIDRTLAIGELILNRFFGGNPATWHDRRRNKNNSIRRLANRKDCPFCRSALNEAVGVFVAVLGLPCVRTFGHIYASHVASVLSLPADHREGILETAEREGWSVRELRQKVVLMRRALGERRGRPVTREAVRAISTVRALIHQLDLAIERVDQVRTTLGSEVRSDGLRLAAEVTRLGSRLLRIAGGRPELMFAPDLSEPLRGVGNL